jgi:DNA polymerase/3'-5' exonuclease PolX
MADIKIVAKGVATSASGIGVDLFKTTPEHWFVSLAVRTGPAELTPKLAASAQRPGLELHAYGTHGIIERTATREQIIPQSEREVFEVRGVPYRELSER